MTQPASARAVLSTQDFSLVRQVVLFYMKEHQGQQDLEKFSSLFHRLGSAARDQH